MNSYSQYGEDVSIAALWPEGFAGTLLDIGAWEPKNLSNTRAFLEAGWSGVLCEFSPEPVRQLVREYADCERVKVVQCAVTPVHQHCLEFQITDDALSAPPGSNTAKAWKDAGGYFGRLWVPTVPIKDIVNQFFGSVSINYLSIDTEGTSVDLLIEFLSLGRRPQAIICEHDGRDQQIWEAAKLAGYTVRDRNETNVILEYHA